MFVFKYFFKKIKRFAFQVDQRLLNQQEIYYDQFNSLLQQPQIFSKILVQEILISILMVLLNLIIFLNCNLPYYQNIYELDIFLYFWSIFHVFFNAISIAPKALAMYKIVKIQVYMSDLVRFQSFLWLFIRCNLNRFNDFIGKIIFFSNVVGLFRSWQLLNKNLNENLWIVNLQLFPIIIFFTRFLVSFYRLNKYMTSNNQQEKGLSKSKINQLKTFKILDMSQPELQNQSCCSICIEDFDLFQIVKKLQCSGNHVFHRDCIDNWLKIKTSCPNCNQKAIQ